MSVELLEGHRVGFPGVFCHPIEWLAAAKVIQNEDRHAGEHRWLQNRRETGYTVFLERER